MGGDEVAGHDFGSNFEVEGAIEFIFAANGGEAFLFVVGDKAC